MSELIAWICLVAFSTVFSILWCEVSGSYADAVCGKRQKDNKFTQESEESK